MPSKSASQAKFMRAIAHSPAFAKKVGVKQSVGKDFEMADRKMKKFGRGGMPKESTTGPSTTVSTTAAARKERKDFEDETRKQNMKAQQAGVRAARLNPDAHAKGGKVSKRYAGAGAVAATGTNTATTTAKPTTTTAATTTAKPAMSFGNSARAFVLGKQADMQARAQAGRLANKNRFMAANRPMAAKTGTTTAGTGTTTGTTVAGMKKGGKAKAKPFAATKFGAAMMKKSADTKGRAMKKFAKGGSIDGIATKGKTKTKRVTMKNGGMC